MDIISPRRRFSRHVLRWIGKPLATRYLSARRPGLESQVSLRLALTLKVGIFVFFSMVFVQADIQWIALLVDTVTEMLAGVWAATVLAPVFTFNLRIAWPNVVQKRIDDNY